MAELEPRLGVSSPRSDCRYGPPEYECLVVQQFEERVPCCKNALIKFPWFKRTCTLRRTLERLKFGTSGHGDFRAVIHC